MIDLDAPRPAWWRNGLGWLLFVVGPACGAAVAVAVCSVLWR